MQWHDPHILYFIFALPLLALFFLWAARRRRRLLTRFASSQVLPRLTRQVSGERQAVKMTLLVAVVALLIVVLARPQYGTVERPVVHKGLDIIVAIDVSTSMLAKDMPPSRLARAKDVLNVLIDRVQGDRVGILTFAGDAFLACPLTVDYGVAHMILDTVDNHSIPTPGTMLGTAIRAATDAFVRAKSPGDRILVLLTDGEDQGSDVDEAIKEAVEKDVRIYCIGIGSTDGAVIELPDGTRKTDREGHLVTSWLDFAALQKIAFSTGGTAIKSAETGYLETDAIVAGIANLRRGELTSKTFSLHEDRFQWALALAIILLVAEWLTSRRRRVQLEWKGRFE